MPNLKPLHHGPMMPLAILAVFAVMIPLITISNQKNTIDDTNAKMKAPVDEPIYVPTQEPTPTTDPFTQMPY